MKHSVDAIIHLSKDKKLKVLVDSQPPFSLKKGNKIYLRLCSSILSQQLSTHVAKVLYDRFIELYDGKEPTAKQILNTEIATFRSIGFSNAKAGYVHNVCRFFIENKITDTALHEMNNEAIVDLLTQIKGVGKWTVEMVLMFSLGREDVFAFDDLGLRQGVIKLYHLKETDKKLLRKKMELITKRWSPYRTYASRYLWNWKDN